MKKRIIASGIFTVISMSVLFAIVAQKERLIARGDRAYFKLAPRDPRSLMQGDYMVLRYALAAELETLLAKKKDVSRNGIAIITLDEDGIAAAVRPCANDGTPAPGEKLLRYKLVNGTVSFGAESFFFQEGHGTYYEKAGYGELVIDDNGSSVLVGLRDKNLNILKSQ